MYNSAQWRSYQTNLLTKKDLYIFNSYNLYLKEMEEKTNKATPARRFKNS